MAPAAWAGPAEDQYAVAAGHYSRQRWELAVEEFREFLRQYPDHARAPQSGFYLGEALMQLGLFDEARQQLLSFVAAHGEHRLARQARFRAAEAAYLLGQNEVAQAELAGFREAFPEDALNAFVLPYLGDLALEAEDYPAAKGLFDVALAKFPQGALQDDCRLGLARALGKQGEREPAERLLEALSSKAASPLADDALYYLGALQYDAGDYSAAIKTFAQFEQQHPDSSYRSQAQLGRAWAHYHRAEHPQARKLLEPLTHSADAAIALESGYWLALTLKAEQHFVEATAVLTDLKADPGDPLAPAIAFHAADALLRAGDPATAAQGFDRVSADWPGSEWHDDALLGQAQAAQARNDHPTIDTVAARLAALQPPSPLLTEVRRIQGRSFNARDMFDEAVALLEPLAADAAAQPQERYLLAVAYLGLKRHEDALQSLEPALAAAEGELLAEASLAQGTALVGLERFADAIAPLERALATEPEGLVASRAQAQLAVSLARTGQLAPAREAYEAFVASQPDAELHQATTQHVAEAALAAGENTWAAELFAALGTPDAPAGTAATGLSGLAWSQYRAGQFAEAAATFDKLVSSYPTDPLAAEAALVRAQVLEKLQQPEPALAAYRLVMERYAESAGLPAALLGAARLHERLSQPAEAAAIYQRLTTDYPELPQRDSVLYHWAWTLRQLDRAAESDTLFEQLRTECPDSRYWADATFRLAERALASGADGHDRAATLTAEALAHQPSADLEQHLLYLQGQVAVARGAWGDVAAPLAQLLERHPQSALQLRSEYWIAESLYRQNRHADALPALEALAPRSVESGEPWAGMVPLRLAQCLVQLDRWDEAQTIVERIAADYPGFTQQYEVDYVLGRCLAHKAEFDLARAAYRRTIDSEAGAKTETAAMAQWMIGETYYHQKEYNRALREYLRVEILYDFPTWQAAALFEAAKCHEALGQWRQAADLYRRLTKDFPNSDLKTDAEQRLAAATERVTQDR
jgi:TolA-binding protein